MRSDIDIGLASRTIESHPSPHPSATAVGWRVKTVSVWQHRRSTNAASTATPMNNTNRRAPSCTPGVGRKVRRFAPREHMPRPHQSRRRSFKRHALRRTLPMREEGARIVGSKHTPGGMLSKRRYGRGARSTSTAQTSEDMLIMGYPEDAVRES